MYHLRLKKALSYDGIISATAKKPDVYTEEKAVADAAVASGYFSLIADAEPEVPPEGNGETITMSLDYEALAKQTKAELIAYAQANGIDLDGLKTKDDILEAISAANGGSYTMMELQRED